MVELSPEQQVAFQEKVKNMSPEELKEFQKKNCIFCQIAAGKVPSQQVYADEKCFAVLDINPACKGHILLLPKEHYAIMPQVPEEILAQLFIVAKYLSQAQLKAFQAKGTTVFVANGVAAGQRAQHFMIHLIPRFDQDGLKVLDLPQKEASEADLQRLRDVLTKKINQIFGLKKETVIEKKPVEEKKEVKPEEKPAEKRFVTSEKAKRFHLETCPFAQQIKPAKRIYLKPDEIKTSERQPCECTGLVKAELPQKKKKTEAKIKKPTKKEIIKSLKEEASLDEISELFN